MTRSLLLVTRGGCLATRTYHISTGVIGTRRRSLRVTSQSLARVSRCVPHHQLQYEEERRRPTMPNEDQFGVVVVVSPTLLPVVVLVLVLVLGATPRMTTRLPSPAPPEPAVQVGPALGRIGSRGW